MNNLIKRWYLWYLNISNKQDSYKRPEWLAEWRPDFSYHCPKFIAMENMLEGAPLQITIIGEDNE